MGLKDYLQMGQSEVMGIKGATDNRRREAEQLGQAMTKAGQYEAEGIANVGKIQADSTRETGEHIASMFRKKPMSEEDILAKKHEYALELLGKTQRGEISKAKAKAKVASQNAIYDDAAKLKDKFLAGKAGAGNYTDSMGVLYSRIDTEGTAGKKLKDSIGKDFISTIATGDAEFSEDFKNKPIFKDNPALYQEADITNLENMIGQKEYGAKWNTWEHEEKTPALAQISEASKVYFEAKGIEPGKSTYKDYTDFLRKLNEEDEEAIGILTNLVAPPESQGQ